MKMLVKAIMPAPAVNAAVREGNAGQKIGRILEELKPEATYFTEEGGKRTAYLVVELAEASQIPSIAEPWFLQFDALVEFHPVMTKEDLGKSGLDSLGKKWTR